MDARTLKTYDATPFLKRVEVIPGAAHVTTWDKPEAMLKAVRDFLAHAESGLGTRTAP